MDIISELKRQAKKTFAKARGSHDWEHTQRVYKLCLQMGKKEKADLAVLRLAAILHDIGRSEEDELKGEICHAQKGAQIASQWLRKYNLEPSFVNKVIHCIESHRFRGAKIPKTKEARILFDADKLDSIGAVGIGRAFLFAGEVGARLHNKRIKLEKTKAYTKEDTAYREYLFKLNKVKDRILTKEGKKIARQRHRFMVEFFKRLNQEVEGKL